MAEEDGPVPFLDERPRRRRFRALRGVGVVGGAEEADIPRRSASLKLPPSVGATEAFALDPTEVQSMAGSTQAEGAPS